MLDGGESARTRSILYCVVPRDLADKLFEPLREHFAADRDVEVLVERRDGDRRSGATRRADHAAPARARERRLIRAAAGRRVGERRMLSVSAASLPALPRRARRYAERLVFIERFEPTSLALEDADTARLVTRFQAGEDEVFSELYLRYFDRVYNYLRVVLKDDHEAEDATQQVFVRVFQALPRYELRAGRPFRAWLFTVVRNYALSEVKKLAKLEVTDPASIDRTRELSSDPETDLSALDWITDRELVMFVERLPLAQRQVLLLRFMLDLTDTQIATVLGRERSDVRMLQSRAQRYLRDRLAAVGRTSGQSRRADWHRRLLRAHVLRARRFALLP